MILQYLDNFEILNEDIAPLDLSFPWYDEQESKGDDVISEHLNQEYIEPGDILLADVYQDKKEKINLDHTTRPFLVTATNDRYAYGFQLTHKPSSAMQHCAVPVEDFARCGLNAFGYILTDMIRGEPYHRIKRKIGHITDQTKDILLHKLREMQDNKNNEYSDCAILYPAYRLTDTIQKIYRIIGK